MSTINQNNILDMADNELLANTPMMVVEQGGKSIAVPLMFKGGAVLQQVITDNTSTVATISMAANTRYVFTQPLTSLTISSVEDSNFESEVQFTTGTSITVNLPDTLKFVGYVGFEPEMNFIVNVKNNIAVVADYE